MRETVLKVIEMYAEGGSSHAARKSQNISGGDFYRTLRDHPDLDQLYRETQRARADMMVDEAYEIGADATLHPSVARVQAEIRMKIAGFFDRPRFGDQVKLEIDQTVSVSDALTAARQRALRPRRDLGNAIDVEPLEQSQLNADSATDKQSVALPKPKVNPFE